MQRHKCNRTAGDGVGNECTTVQTGWCLSLSQSWASGPNKIRTAAPNPYQPLGARDMDQGKQKVTSHIDNPFENEGPADVTCRFGE